MWGQGPGALSLWCSEQLLRRKNKRRKSKNHFRIRDSKERPVIEARTAAAVAAKNIPSPEVRPLEKFQKRERQDRGTVFIPQSTALVTLGMEGDQGTSQIRQGC